MIEKQGDPLWYKDAIIYELHIKAYKDSNGDGIGDFNGLISCLDYLQDLGITVIWLLPFYPSPQRDGGYDISDYYNINPDYGTIEQFQILLQEAHKRNLKVITELVLNHTSDQHPWFQRARTAPSHSHYRDFYVWSDTTDLYTDARIIFQDFESSNWTWDPIAKAYYWHRFYSHQPDLNFDHPEVQQEVFNIINFWCDMGVDGFRLDAIPYLFERDGTNCENLPETHTFLKALRAHVETNYGPKLLLAEANMWPEDAVAYFGDGDECHMNYQFPIMPRMFMALKMEDRYPIIDIIDQTPNIPDNCQWAIFLRNHDELTLEMVTDEERDYMHKAYGKDTLSRINLGLRHRLAPLLDNDRQKIELMNCLLFSLPGTPVVYYGDEIGMGDNVYLGDRDGVRTPMQWSPDRNAGFSNTNPQKLFLPLIMDPEYKYETINVETQQKNHSSLLWWMKKMIDMRKRYQAMGRGDIQFLDPANNKILAFIRTYEDETLLVIANLSRFPQSVQLDLSDFSGMVPIEVFSQNPFPLISKDPYTFTLGRYGYFWFSLEPEYAFANNWGPRITKVIQTDKWEHLFEGELARQLAIKYIRPYLKSVSWFGGHSRKIDQVQIKETYFTAFSGGEVMLTILEVSYHESLPELYFLPLSYHISENVNIEHSPPGAFGIIKLNQLDIWLCDATYLDTFQLHLIRQMVHARRQTSGLIFSRDEDQVEILAKVPDPCTPKVMDHRNGFTLIDYAGQLHLKIYRKIDLSPNPDAELSQFLSMEVHFPHVLPFLGRIDYKPTSSQALTLGTWVNTDTQKENGWDYISNKVLKYFEKVLLVLNNEEILPIPKSPSFFTSHHEDFEPYFDLIGATTINNIKEIGIIMGEFHREMMINNLKIGFEPEPFSLHYQRSLYAALQSLTRESIQRLEKNMNLFPESNRKEAQLITTYRADMLNYLKRLYASKMEAIKSRIHGDFHLAQMYYTGKEFVIAHFAGESHRAFSEQRLRKSPLRDVAAMIRSFHYAAYTRLLFHQGVRVEDANILQPWAEIWYKICSNIFLASYQTTCKGQAFIPRKEENFTFLLEVFLLERALYELKEELIHRPEWAILPIKGIISTLNILKEERIVS